MLNILLPEKLSAEGEAMLEGRVNILRSDGTDEEALCRAVTNADGIVLRSKARISEAVLACAPKLRVVSRTGAGIDNVDVEACTRHGVMVCHLPGINARTVAEHALTCMLVLLKQLPRMDKAVREGNWAIRNRNLPQDAAGKTVGIIGLGKIGRELAARCRALDMAVIGYDPFVKEAEGIEWMNLDDVLAKADIVSLHLPETEATHHLLNAERIARMKPSAMVVNTSRGGVIDQRALEAALSSGVIAAAALDVFEDEPPAAGCALFSMENVILTPHVAALTEQCGALMMTEAVRQALAALEGGTPPHVANARGLEERG